ncbi:MAG: head maturation protease, ClpP-related [Rhizobiaceae bacterium]
MIEIQLHGIVGENFTAASVQRQLPQTGDVTVYINSGGGDAAEGAAIHAALTAHPGHVGVEVRGIAASAASLIAMAGKRIIMADGAILMIHDPMNITIGNSEDHAKTIEQLEAFAKSYARIYAKRSGKSESEARALMKAETWFDGPAAVAAGFADAIADRRAEPFASFEYGRYPKAKAVFASIAAKRADAQTEARDSWRRVLSELGTLKPGIPVPPKSDPHGWSKIVATHNKRHGKR